MITLILSLVLSTAHAQTPYPGSTLLRDLPDGARLQVNQQIQLGTINDDAHEQQLHFCTFEDGDCSPSSFEGFLASFHSQLNLRTDVEDALIETDPGFFSSDYALSPGTYCLEKSISTFDSGGDSHRDILKFTDCAGTRVFTIYANAGYSLRNSEGFRGYTISEFNFQAGFQAGALIRFVK
ncbi:MAG: hypothetical protein KGP28_02520 [Bdellovibrionales bacterium]|nr:hypothetical protein [Bdellovibrionales bacterium]